MTHLSGKSSLIQALFRWVIVNPQHSSLPSTIAVLGWSTFKTEKSSSMGTALATLGSMFCDLPSLWYPKILHCSLVRYEIICARFPLVWFCTWYRDLTKMMRRDPQRTRTDVELISVLQRADIITTDRIADPVAEAKFGLDSVVNDEGMPIFFPSNPLLYLCMVRIKL